MEESEFYFSLYPYGHSYDRKYNGTEGFHIHIDTDYKALVQFSPFIIPDGKLNLQSGHKYKNNQYKNVSCRLNIQTVGQQNNL